MLASHSLTTSITPSVIFYVIEFIYYILTTFADAAFQNGLSQINTFADISCPFKSNG